MGTINDLATIYDGTIGAQNQLNAQIAESELKSFMDAFTFGGVLIGGREKEMIISNNVMDINGLGRFGISGEAYNYKNETNVNISQLYYDAMKGTMTSEQKEIFKEIKTWTNDNVFYKNNFYTSIVNISGDEESKLGSEENYQTYKHVIDKYLER